MRAPSPSCSLAVFVIALQARSPAACRPSRWKKARRKAHFPGLPRPLLLATFLAGRSDGSETPTKPLDDQSWSERWFAGVQPPFPVPTFAPRGACHDDPTTTKLEPRRPETDRPSDSTAPPAATSCSRSQRTAPDTFLKCVYVCNEYAVTVHRARLVEVSRRHAGRAQAAPVISKTCASTACGL